MIEVDQHHHPSLGGHAGQGDEPHRHRDRKIEAEPPKQPQPPTSEKGSESITIRVSVKAQKFKYSSRKMISSVTGTTTFSRAAALSKYSYCPLQVT
jgi:hypothetical protein